MAEAEACWFQGVCHARERGCPLPKNGGGGEPYDRMDVTYTLASGVPRPFGFVTTRPPGTGLALRTGRLPLAGHANPPPKGRGVLQFQCEWVRPLCGLPQPFAVQRLGLLLSYGWVLRAGALGHNRGRDLRLATRCHCHLPTPIPGGGP